VGVGTTSARGGKKHESCDAMVAIVSSGSAPEDMAMDAMTRQAPSSLDSESDGGGQA
jgi:hypothetical protein